ncbi:MAG: hypothetical protein FJ267_02410 [Planctomycetes bacterium]|nr:hypothetical protein [Planctomycetota bacterium]
MILDDNAVITDIDSANISGGKLTAKITAGSQASDRLEIRNQGTGAGQIGVNGSNVTFSGVVIGTFSGGVGSTALTVTFNASATPTMAQWVLRNITFRNIITTTPPTVTRTVQVSLTDGDGGTSNLPTKSVLVTLSAAPVIGAFDTAVPYSAGAAAVILDSNATVTDSDSPNFSAGKLTVALTANAQSSDRLAIRHQGTTAGLIGISGSNVKFGGITIGTFTGGSGSTALVITLNSNATPTATQALLRNITYRNTSATPSTLARTVKVTLTDGDGGTSNSPTKQINVSL